MLAANVISNKAMAGGVTRVVHTDYCFTRQRRLEVLQEEF